MVVFANVLEALVLGLLLTQRIELALFFDPRTVPKQDVMAAVAA
jgi:hypothetical protein